MKYLIAIALCLFISGCAAKSSSGGDMVGNGLVPSRPMQAMDAGEGCGCGKCGEKHADGASCGDHKAAGPGEADCGCGHKGHQKGAKPKSKKAI